MKMRVKVVGMRHLDENFLDNQKINGDIHLFFDKVNKHDKSAIEACYLDKETGEFVRFGYISKDTKKFANVEIIYKIVGWSYYSLLLEEFRLDNDDDENEKYYNNYC